MVPSRVNTAAKGRYGAAYFNGVSDVMSRFSATSQAINSQANDQAIATIGAITNTVMAGFDSYRQYSMEREKIQYDRDRALVADRQWQMGYERQLKNDEITAAGMALENERKSIELVKLRMAKDLEIPTAQAKMGFASQAQAIRSNLSRLRTDNVVNVDEIQKARAQIQGARNYLDFTAGQNPGMNLSEEVAKLDELEKGLTEASMVDLGGKPTSIASIASQLRAPQQGLDKVKFYANVATSTSLPRQWVGAGEAVGNALFAGSHEEAASIIGGAAGLDDDTKASIAGWVTGVRNSPVSLARARDSWIYSTNNDVQAAMSARPGISIREAAVLVGDPRGADPVSAPTEGPAADVQSVLRATDGPSGWKTSSIASDAEMAARVNAQFAASRAAGNVNSIQSVIDQRVRSGVGLDVNRSNAFGISETREPTKAESDRVLRQVFITNMLSMENDRSYYDLADKLPALESHLARQDDFYKTKFGSKLTGEAPVAGRYIDSQSSGYARLLQRWYRDPAAVDAQPAIASLYQRVYGVEIQRPADPLGAALMNGAAPAAQPLARTLPGAKIASP